MTDSDNESDSSLVEQQQNEQEEEVKSDEENPDLCAKERCLVDTLKGTHHRYQSKIRGLANGMKLRSIVVLSDKKSPKQMYYVHRKWISLREGAVYVPTFFKQPSHKVNMERVVDWLIIKSYARDTTRIPWTVRTRAKTEEIQLLLKWGVFPIKMLYAHFGMY